MVDLFRRAGSAVLLAILTSQRVFLFVKSAPAWMRSAR